MAGEMAKKDQKEGPPRCYSCLTAPRHQRMQGHCLYGELLEDLFCKNDRLLIEQSLYYLVDGRRAIWNIGDLVGKRFGSPTGSCLLAEFKTLRGETEGRKS